MIKEFKDKYKWLSNFATVDINLNNIIYHSVEHAYQSEKCDFVWWKNLCSDKSNSAEYIKRKSKQIKLVDNWLLIREPLMKHCLIQKFNTEPYKTLLLETGNQEIQNGNYWNDTFWGIDLKTKEGENTLGLLIMNIRRQLHDNRL